MPRWRCGSSPITRAGKPYCHGTGGHLHARWNHCPGRDYGATANYRPIQNDGPHSDQAFVFDGAGVNHGAMANRNVITNYSGKIGRQVYNGTILNIRPLPDDYLFNVPPDNRLIKNAGVGSDSNISHDVSRFGDPCRGVHPRGGS